MPKSKRPQPVSNPDKPPQTIRGGFIVVRRDDRTSRLLTGHGTAYEHASPASAKAQATVLAERFGHEFAVFCEIDAAVPLVRLDTIDETPAPRTAAEPSMDPVEEPSTSRRRGTLTLPKTAPSS